MPNLSQMAVAKTQASQYELLFIGPELLPSSRLLQECMTFTEWANDDKGQRFFANSLSLPEGEHGASICAFIVTEFSRLDQALTLAEKFLQFEKFLEQFFKKEMLSEDETIGLLGELHILHALLLSAGKTDRERVLDIWQGFQHVSRDFVYGER